MVTPGLAVLKFGVINTVSAAASPDAQLELMVGSPIVCLFLSPTRDYWCDKRL